MSDNDNERHRQDELEHFLEFARNARTREGWLDIGLFLLTISAVTGLALLVHYLLP